MIQVPPGFDISAFASDLFSVGAGLVGIVAIFTAWSLVKKALNLV